MNIGIILLALHLICCALVYLGIRSRALKVEMHIMPLVVFVPLSGLLCCLILHFRLFLKRGIERANGVEKMQLQEDIYRSSFTEGDRAQGKVVSMEEALLINDSRTRRDLMMGVLNDHPEQYVDVLMLARMNEDVEVVHYATTALSELSKRYDAQLLRLEAEWHEHGQDGALLGEYADFLRRYLKQGIAEGQHERDQRRKYIALLERQIAAQPQPQLYHELAESRMKLSEYGAAKLVLDEMEERWPRLADCRMLKIEYFARSGQSDALMREISLLDEDNIYVSYEDRRRLEFWKPTKEDAE